MAISEADIQSIKEKIGGLIGERVWAPGLGVGSFITCEFGKALPPSAEGYTRGEWHLWVCCCAWRLENRGEVIVGSDDERDNLQKAVQELEGLALRSIEIIPPAADTVFRFEDGMTLRLFAYRFTGEYEHWKLFTPSRKVLVIGPGTSWSYVDAYTPLSG